MATKTATKTPGKTAREAKLEEYHRLLELSTPDEAETERAAELAHYLCADRRLAPAHREVWRRHQQLLQEIERKREQAKECNELHAKMIELKAERQRKMQEIHERYDSEITALHKQRVPLLGAERGVASGEVQRDNLRHVFCGIFEAGATQSAKDSIAECLALIPPVIMDQLLASGVVVHHHRDRGEDEWKVT